MLGKYSLICAVNKLWN